MLSRNYSTRDFFYTENGNNNKCKYSVSTASTCNNLNLNQSFELDSFQKGKFYDNDLDKSMNLLFGSMDSFYSEEKRLDDYRNEIQSKINEMESKINEINNYYSNKKEEFIKQFQIKKDTILENYCKSKNLNYQSYLENQKRKKNKKNLISFCPLFGDIERMESKLNSKFKGQYDAFLNEIENKKNKEINYYKEEIEKEQCKKIFSFY